MDRATSQQNNSACAGAQKASIDSSGQKLQIVASTSSGERIVRPQTERDSLPARPRAQSLRPADGLK